MTDKPKAHARRIGLRTYSKRPSYRPANTKLTNDDAKEIRLRYSAGEAGKRLAREFRISTGDVCNIVRGNRFKDAGGPLTFRRKRGN